MSLEAFEANKLNFTVYPNPSNGDFNIQFKEIPTQGYSISILDRLGSKVYVEEVKEGGVNHTIRPELNNGLYVIQLVMDGNTYTHKIIKN